MDSCAFASISMVALSIVAAEAEIREVQARAAAKAKAPMREIHLDFAISTHFLSSFIIPRVVESP